MATDDVADANDVLRSLAGRSLNQLGVSVGELALALDALWTVHLSSPVRVGGTFSGEPMSIDGVAAHMPLLNSDLTDVRIDARGNLTLAFGATTVRCDADPQYEAWTIGGPDGELIVCMPGGEVAVWAARTA